MAKQMANAIITLTACIIENYSAAWKKMSAAEITFIAYRISAFDNHITASIIENYSARGKKCLLQKSH